MIEFGPFFCYWKKLSQPCALAHVDVRVGEPQTRPELPTVNLQRQVARQLRNQTSRVVATDALSQLSSRYRRDALMPAYTRESPSTPNGRGDVFVGV
jgi:hypothetical protein